MRKYTALLRMRFLHGLQYRSAAIAGICTQFAWGSLEILMFHAFYEADPSAFPMSFEALCAYVWLQQAFLALYMTWFWEMEIFDSIQNGNVAYELCRPMDVYAHWFCRNIATRCAKAVLRCMPILCIAIFLPAPYRLVLPKDGWTMLFFLISMLFALLVIVALNMIVYALAFFMLNTSGIRMLFTSLADFLTGAIIPLPFLPDSLREIMELLPFAAVQNIPFRIYSGDIYGTQMAFSLALQVFWILVLILIGSCMMRYALRRVVVQGG